MNDLGIDPLNSKLIEVDSVTPSTDFPWQYLFAWDSKNWCALLNDGPHNLTITFKKPVTILKYQMQILYKVRYLTGWQFEISYDGNYFTVVDEKDENFCSTNYTHDGVIDCGTNTARTFPIPISSAKSVRLSMTKPDSTGTYQMELSGIDFYIDSQSTFTYFCSSKKLISYTLLFVTILLG